MNRSRVVVLLIGALFALNLWKWWPNADSSPEGQTAELLSSKLKSEAFRIRSLPPDGKENLRGAGSNPFTRPDQGKSGPKLREKLVPLGDERDAGPELAQQQARKGKGGPDKQPGRRLKGYRLQGILVRSDGAVALLAKGGRMFSVWSGKRLEGGVVVKDVSPRAVVLKSRGGEAWHTLRLESK